MSTRTPLFVAVACCLLMGACSDGAASSADGTSAPADTLAPADSALGPDAADASAPDPDSADAASAADTADTAAACACAVGQRCEGAACVCQAGLHPGGDPTLGCVGPGVCHPGFAIPSGGTDCVPGLETCHATLPCTAVTGWTDGACTFGPAPEGTPCAGPAAAPCAANYACHAGSCAPAVRACSDARRPVVLVHGINGSSADFAVMIDRLVADGWPREWLFAFDAADPSWGCNVDNAAAIAALVQRARDETCEARVDLVAHSMGTLSSRYFVKNLGGQDLVNTYVTLGGPHHGLSSPCWAPASLGICVWTEMCESGEYVGQLNAAPATPGKVHWVSIYGTADATIPNASSILDGAENIAITGAEHAGANGLNEREDVYQEVKRVLLYPCVP